MRFAVLVPVFISLWLFSCDDSKIFDSNVKIKNDVWLEKDSLKFDINVSDNSLEYNNFYNIRYNKEYPYHNLYIKYYLLDSTGKVIQSHLNNMDIFDPKTGVPLGNGLGDSYDYAILFLENYKFPYKGKFSFVTKHYMRDEPLKGIESVGIKVAKAKYED